MPDPGLCGCQDAVLVGERSQLHAHARECVQCGSPRRLTFWTGTGHLCPACELQRVREYPTGG